MRRAVLSLALTLVVPAQALARAGGGSSGYGGGGGGGGSGYAGRNGANGGSWEEVLAVVLLAALFFLGSALLTWRTVRRRKARVARTVTASAEADDDDAWFAADAVTKETATLFCDVQAAWDARDRERLRQMIAPDLMVEWERRLDDFDLKRWHNRVEVRKGPKVEYVGLVNREDDTEDRVCLRLSGSLFDIVETNAGEKIHRHDQPADVSKFAEYWTLARQRSTCRSWTTATRPTCSKWPRARRSPPGPKRSTATTPRSRRSPSRTRCGRCSTAATGPEGHGW